MYGPVAAEEEPLMHSPRNNPNAASSWQGIAHFLSAKASALPTLSIFQGANKLLVQALLSRSYIVVR